MHVGKAGDMARHKKGLAKAGLLHLAQHSATCLARIDIRLVLQVCNVSRQVAAGWCYAELVLKQ